MHGYSGDQSDQGAGLRVPHTDYPLLVLSRGRERPLQKLPLVIEAEHVVLVLDVVLH